MTTATVVKARPLRLAEDDLLPVIDDVMCKRADVATPWPKPGAYLLEVRHRWQK